jgi:mannose-6-phosphate isomerase-like protein (cupin superfamily)
VSTKPTESNLSSTDAYDFWIDKHLLSRRQALGLGVLTASSFASAATLVALPKLTFSKASEDEVARPYPNVHEGNGTISVRFFPFDKSPTPAHFVIYQIPPGASEGVHTHHLGDTVLGPFDEYYYIIAGQGEMLIDGNAVAVKAGDHVHTPLGVSHGISNTGSKESLKVFLTFITRES